jgi:hypothetical protein
MESTTSSGRSILDVVLTVFRNDELAVLREVRQARLELVGLLVGPLRLLFREARVLAGPALRTTSGFSPSEGAASVASETLFWTVADSSATV